MSFWKNLDIQRRNAADRNDRRGSTAAEEIAAALGGDVVNGRVVAIYPDGTPVTLTPRWGRLPFIYGCTGDLGAVKQWLREQLGEAGLDISDDADPRAQHERIAAAARLWERGADAAGTEVTTYLQSRGIDLPPSSNVRLLRMHEHKPTGSFWPVMLARVSDAADRMVAVHRTYLATDGRSKAPVGASDVKMSLGPAGGGAVRLAPFDPGRELMIGEGIETALSAMVMTPGIPAWSAISAGNLRQLVLPAEARDVIVLVDNDEEGERAALFAAGHWKREGRRVRLARPPAGFNDFNDVLIGSGTTSEGEA